MEWIKFSDKMPDRRSIKEILTFEKIVDVNGKVKSIICIEETKSIHKDKNGFYSDGGGENLTHWMLLPDSPKNL